MFDRLIKQIDDMMQRYLNKLMQLEKTLEQTNKLLEEQNDLVRGTKSCGGNCNCNK